MDGLETNETSLLDLTWKSLRESIAKSVLAESGLVPVPNLSSAKYFGLFSVFVKNRSSYSTVPKYIVLGHMSEVIKIEKTDLDRLMNSAIPHHEDFVRAKKWEGDVDFGTKSVHLTVEGLSKIVVSLNMNQGDLYLKEEIPDLTDAKSIYIITDVVKASCIHAVFTGDDDSWMKKSVHSEPIGFGYSKFRLTSNGLVSEQMKTKPSINGKWEVAVDRLSDYFNALPD